MMHDGKAENIVYLYTLHKAFFRVTKMQSLKCSGQALCNEYFLHCFGIANPYNRVLLSMANENVYSKTKF